MVRKKRKKKSKKCKPLSAEELKEKRTMDDMFQDVRGDPDGSKWADLERGGTTRIFFGKKILAYALLKVCQKSNL